MNFLNLSAKDHSMLHIIKQIRSEYKHLTDVTLIEINPEPFVNKDNIINLFEAFRTIPVYKEPERNINPDTDFAAKIISATSFEVEKFE